MAENIFDRLQLVRGLNPLREDGIFDNRVDAINYVLGKHLIERPSLEGEPIVLRYDCVEDDCSGPNVILAIGSKGDGTQNTGNTTFFIDTKKTEEEIEDLRELIEEAIKSLTIVPLTSDTINMFAEKTEDGTLLSGDVKIADYRIVSGKVEENIIETEGEKGIYAFVDMEYDPDTFVITFRTTKVSKEFQLPKDQHVEKGWYDVRDESIHLKLADGTIVPILLTNLIEEWTVLGEASNTPLVLIKEHVSAITEGHEGIYDWQDVLSGDVRVASHINDNILQKDRTGRYLYVKGTADNIKYKEGVTVKDALDNMECKVSTSTGNLIYKRPDGIYATAMVGYNTAENKLTYTYSEGNTGELKTVEFQLNSVKLLEDITYDPVNEMIVIRYIDAQGEYQRVEIPVHDIIEEWDINNEGHNIKLNKFRSQGQGKDILTADAKIHVGDNNILEDLSHELYVNGIADNLKYDVTGDTTVKDVLDSLSGATDGIQDEIDRIDATIGSGFTSDPHENITAKFEQLNEKIESEIERSTEKDNELEAKIDEEIERSTEKDTEHDGKIQAIEDEIGDGFGPRNTVRDEIDNLQDDIDSLSAETASKLADIDSDNSINIDKTNPTVPVISVNLSEEPEQGRPNIIKLNNDGLYAGVDLAYEETANKLIFTTTNGSKEIQLDSMSSIISIEYNPTKEAIVITYMTNGHEIKTVEIPVGDLINEWRVEDGHPHAVALEKVRVASGTSEQDVLKASVIITDGHDDNILVMDDGALYVSGAQIEQNKQDIADLKDRMDVAEDDIDALEDGLANEIERATNAETDILDRLNDEITRSTTEDERLLSAITAETAAREYGDAELEEAIRAAKLTFSPSLDGLESDGTIMFNDYTTDGNTVKAKVMLQDGDNIIKVGNGLYATATLEYEPTGNKLRLVTSNGAQEYIQLVGATLLDSIEYDTTNKMLIIKYTDGTGSQRETTVGVTDLWNEWIVQNPSEKSAVELTKTIGDPGNPDTISGRVLITDDRDGDGKPDEGSPNIVEIRNNGLFVDGTAMEDAKEIAECVQNEIKVFEKAVIGHIIGEECGSGYTYEPWNTAYYINSATSYNNADYMLDLNLKKVENYVDEVSAKTDCVDAKTDKVYEMLYGEGSRLPECGEGAKYQPYVGACVISGATSFMEADQLLNDQICQILTMWVSGKTCSTESEWIEDGANRKIQVDVRLSRGNQAEMTDEDVIIETLNGGYVDPTRTEFTDTNALRIVCLTEGPSGTTPSIDSMQNGVYLCNAWDCGLYYDEATEADEIAAAQEAGYKTDNYRTDTASTASNYNYMNNVRQHDI